MAFTEFIFDHDEIKAKTEEYKAGLKANAGRDDFVKNAVETFLDRLKADKKRYRDYGPYWPALKSIMIKYDAIHGDNHWPDVASVYCGDSDEETVVMAEEFRSFYLSQYFLYSNQFELDGDSNEEWVCYDPDME